MNASNILERRIAAKVSPPPQRGPHHEICDPLLRKTIRQLNAIGEFRTDVIEATYDRRCRARANAHIHSLKTARAA